VGEVNHPIHAPIYAHANTSIDMPTVAVNLSSTH
jgi:hypothetical protein